MPLQHPAQRPQDSAFQILRPVAWAALLFVGLVMSGCGGGGSGASGSSPEAPADAGGSTPVEAGESKPLDLQALRIGANEFLFSADEGIQDAQVLARTGGGALLAQWNPRDPQTALAPGVKVSFFGLAEGCDFSTANGPTTSDAGNVFAAASTLTGVAVPAADTGLRWSPAGNTSGCGSASQSMVGPTAVYLNPNSGAGGGVGLYTTSGPLADGSAPFFHAYGAGGIDGNGTNANGLSSFFAIRRAWWAQDAVHPWQNAAGNASSDARVASTQNIASYSIGQTVDGNTVQVKQQIIAEFVNTACVGSGATGPCVLQYLFNTAVYRAGVSDWSTYLDSSKGSIWYDPDQGSIPIVEGQLPQAGVTVSDKASGMALFSSAGTSTRHGTFAEVGFDVRISFEQAVNAMKLVTAAKTGTSAAQVSDAQMATVWGARWNDKSAWALVHGTVGQEVYNQTFATRNAWIGGGFRQLYIGSVD